MTDKDQPILKGERGCLRLIVPEGVENGNIPGVMKKALEDAGKLVEGATLILDFQGRALSGELVMEILETVLLPRSVTVREWRTFDGKSQEILKKMGLRTFEKDPQERKGPAGFLKNIPSPALILHRSLRSGQRVEHDGDIIIIGNVNEGAEVYGTGSICIWGRLCGLAHAGCSGDESVAVVAGHFIANQVRIGEKICYLDVKAPWWGKPVRMVVKGDEIVVDEVAF
ncbi:MAG: septum site-determining protein MinC [Thermovirgaceae bacterium]